MYFNSSTDKTDLLLQNNFLITCNTYNIIVNKLLNKAYTHQVPLASSALYRVRLTRDIYCRTEDEKRRR
jgi:hypothetical protein